MITRVDKILFGIIGLLVILTFVFWKDIKAFPAKKPGVEKVEKDKKEKKGGKKDKENNKSDNNSEVSILEKWDLPGELKEVSGIVYLDDQRFACVQDEAGTIFIFNRQSNKIEKKIPFAESGDYEGITIKGNTAYVIRADGMIYEVNMNTGKGSLKQYKTSLTEEHNIEGICYDKNNDRLLLAIKDDEPGKKNYKGVYAFDLVKKVFDKEPVYKIDLQHQALNAENNKKNKTIMPSEIGIHPVSNDILITDGPNARLLIMDNSGNIKNLYTLGKSFSQPEGITFSPEGEIFISNEGTKEPGNIIKIEMQ